jgi:hypothetical protein
MLEIPSVVRLARSKSPTAGLTKALGSHEKQKKEIKIIKNFQGPPPLQVLQKRSFFLTEIFKKIIPDNSEANSFNEAFSSCLLGASDRFRDEPSDPVHDTAGKFGNSFPDPCGKVEKQEVEEERGEGEGWKNKKNGEERADEEN